jgi:hypothetical protein
MTAAVQTENTEDQKHTVLDIDIADIVIPTDRKRDYNPIKVKILQKSIGGEYGENGLGLISPICLTPDLWLDYIE